MQLALHALGLLVIGNVKLEEPAVAVEAFGVVRRGRVVGEEVPIRHMAGNAAERLEELFAARDVPRDAAAGGGGVIEQIPLDHVEVSLADFLAVTVAVGVILADAGRSLDGAAVLERLSDKLLGAGIG